MSRATLALYRIRGPLYYVAAAILITNAILAPIPTHEEIRAVRGLIALAGLVIAALCVLLTFVGPRLLPTNPTRTVHSPVLGRWLGMNSPTTKVPSHGVRAYGQAYAIDLVYAPTGSPRPEFGEKMMNAPALYPAFGEPVVAMIDGTVVRASDWRRDHRARSSWLGFVYLMVEGAIRELGGPGFVIGNHVTIRSADDIYATVAHLQNGSLTVSVGDRVTAGDQIGSCGNSGNSSEPHVHAQLMDRASPWIAQGLPMAFAGITLGEDVDNQYAERVDGLPENERYMHAYSRADSSAMGNSAPR